MRRRFRNIAIVPVLSVLFMCTVVIAAKPKKLDRRVVARLSGKSEVVRQQATMELQQFAQLKFRFLPELIEALKTNCEQIDSDIDDVSDEPPKVTSFSVPNSLFAQLYLVGSTQHKDAEECLTGLLGNKHSGVTMLVADVLGKNKFFHSIEAISKLKNNPAFDRSYGYRFNLVRSLAQMEHPRSIEILTSWRLSIDGQLRHEIEKYLAEVAEDDFGDDLDRYDAWKTSMTKSATEVAESSEPAADGSKIVLQSSSESSESLDRLRFSSKHQYYGMDLYAKRLMFIIDHSGSMEEFSSGMTRLQRAKLELISVINELDPNTEFAIMFYETTVRTWRDELVLASDENKREAIQFIKRLGFGDRTNTYTALRNSIEYSDELEAVYLLTDGQPTEGPITSPPAIVKDIMHRNRFRHVNFNTIGVSVSGPTETFLKTLATESGGEFRALH